MSMQFICTIHCSASGVPTSGKSTIRDSPVRRTVRNGRVGIHDGMPFGACFWKYDGVPTPMGVRFIVNGRSRRCGRIAGAIAP